MPTRILYELTGPFADRQRAAKLDNGFFRDYNPFAITAISQGHGRTYAIHAIENEVERNFFSRPSVWAAHVVEGIKLEANNKQLIKAGKFLHDAALMGFSLEKLAQKHLNEVSQKYVSVDELVKNIPETEGMPQDVLDFILGKDAIRARSVPISTGYGTKVRFVPRGKVHNFVNALKRQLPKKLESRTL